MENNAQNSFMNSAQITKEKRKGKYWNLYDPDRHFEDLVDAAVIRLQDHLHRDEQTSQGLLKLIIKDIDVAVLAIRPKPVAPANELEEVSANMSTESIPVK